MFSAEATGNGIILAIAFASGLVAWGSVNSQVNQNTASLLEEKEAIRLIAEDLNKLKTDVAVISNDAQHTVKVVEEIKTNQKQIITLLSQG